MATQQNLGANSGMVLYDGNGNYLAGAQLLLSTRKGRQIPNERRPERAPAAMLAAKDLVVGSHQTAQLRSLSAVYNCMGMVYATRRTWVDPEDLPTIVEDDGYRRLPGPDQAMPGDVVVYKDSDGAVVHVGLVSQIIYDLESGGRELIVLSQWGADGEYFHRIDDVHPYLGTPTEYWSDRT